MGTVTVVFDTNVLVSALIWSGKPEQCLDFAFGNDDVRMLRSDETTAELERVLEYPKFESYITAWEAREYRAAFEAAAEQVEPSIDLEVVDDPDDDMFVELAVAGGADYLVSGDRTVLRLEEHDGVTILSADEFLAEMGR
jgi:putative PIN family toxin of toxin-antitoxin system